MRDRELLEMAAKAAGIEWKESAIDWGGLYINGGGVWNPLEDDGDALCLAANLRIGIGDRETTVTAKYKSGMSLGSVYAEEHSMADPCASTRRAIVRVAAKIGESM